MKSKLNLLMIIIGKMSLPVKAEPTSHVNINFYEGRITASGYYKNIVKTPGNDAELNARSDGIKNLRTAINKSCNSAFLNPDWASSVKSEGSNIYSPPITLEILLSLALKSLISNTYTLHEKPWSTEDDKKIVISIPQSSLNADTCPPLLLKYAKSEWSVLPLPTKTSTSKAHIITLKWKKEDSRHTLTADEKDHETLDKILKAENNTVQGKNTKVKIIPLHTRDH